MDSFIHILGCGDAFSAGGRNNTCFLLNYHGDMILIDFGATSMPVLKSTGYDLSKINTIILSHFHGDHFGGIPAFILNAAYAGEYTSPLTIYSPPQGREKLSSLMESMYPGTTSLLDELPVQFRYYSGKEEVYESFSVLGLPVEHTPASIPHGIRIKFPEFTFGFSGDTRWCPNLIELAQDTDLFITECNFLDKPNPIHLDYGTLLQHIPQISSKKIMLSHMSEEVINSTKIEVEKLSDGLKIPV